MIKYSYLFLLPRKQSVLLEAKAHSVFLTKICFVVKPTKQIYKKDFKYKLKITLIKRYKNGFIYNRLIKINSKG